MTSTENDFRRLRFKTPDAIDRRWLEWFREEFSRHMFRAEVEPCAEMPFWLDATSRLLPDLAFYIGGASPMRTRATTAAAQEETFGMTVALAGDMSIQSDDDDVVLAPGAGVFGRPALLDTRSNTKVLSVRLSSQMLASLVPNLQDLSLVPLPANSQPMRLLIAYLKVLDAEETIDTPEARRLAAVHVHDLAALAIGANREAAAVANGRGVRAARLAAIKQDILSTLADPHLSVPQIFARHKVSPRYIHMLFELEGVSFSEYVVRERLQRAHQILTDPRFVKQPIGAIALAVGFGDLSYFNRTFRRKFGATPSEVRQQFRQERG